jgi:hypothetical protein
MSSKISACNTAILMPKHHPAWLLQGICFLHYTCAKTCAWSEQAPAISGENLFLLGKVTSFTDLWQTPSFQ